MKRVRHDANDSHDVIVDCALYEDGRRRPGELRLDELAAACHAKHAFVWIGLYEPNEPLLRKIQEEFGLHELAIEDALSAHQRPKVERYENSLFVVMRTAQIEDPKPNKPCDVQYGEIIKFDAEPDRKRLARRAEVALRTLKLEVRERSVSP